MVGGSNKHRTFKRETRIRCRCFVLQVMLVAFVTCFVVTVITRRLSRVFHTDVTLFLYVFYLVYILILSPFSLNLTKWFSCLILSQ